MRFSRLLATLLVVATVTTTALAVVHQRAWSPDEVKQNPGEFSVTSKMGDDGLIHFKVTRKLAEPCWIQANLVVRKGKTRIVETHFPAFVRENSITYYFEISPDYLADSILTVSEAGIGYAVNAKDQRDPLPGTGGIDNVFRLKLFAPEALAKKTAPPAK